MEINIQVKTRFEVGDIVYWLKDTTKEIFKCKIFDIVVFYQAKASIKTWYIYDLESNGKIISVYEEQLFKTEYEAKIALGNMS